MFHDDAEQKYKIIIENVKERLSAIKEELDFIKECL